MVNTIPSWTAEDTPHGRVYRRLMGSTEQGFFWDAEFTGTADSVQHCLVDVLSGSDVFSERNVSRAWITLKQQFPFLGAQFELPNEDPEQPLYISVSENRLVGVQPGELIFKNIASLQEAEVVLDDILNGPRTLSRDRQACVHILRRTDVPNLYHLMLQICHAISDGMSNGSFLRNFLDTVSAGDRSNLTQPPRLERRLPSLLSLEELRGRLDHDHPRMRWRRAIGQVLSSRIASRMTGGQTLPRTISESTPWTPARSGYAYAEFSPKESTQVLATCRKNKITFGHALTVLGQVALSRVLHRRYLRGEISEEEWEHRKRQPMHQGGPVNLRPYMDKEWYQNGGGGDIVLSIGFSFATLPFMPFSNSRDDLDQGSPKVETLLSRKRFFHRCRIVKSANDKVLKSPLMLETTVFSARVGRGRSTALLWKKIMGRAVSEEDDHDLATAKNTFKNAFTPSFVFGFGGSSIGNVDHIVPPTYPLPSSHPLSPLHPFTHPLNAGHKLPAPRNLTEECMNPKPVLHLRSSVTRLHCRPAELYLGAKTARGSLQVLCFFDENVYTPDTVEEWIKEVQYAAKWYLGRDNVELDIDQDLSVQVSTKL